MPRMLRRLGLLVFLLAAWALVGSDRAPSPMTLGQAIASQSSRAEASVELPRASGDRPSPHELASLRIFTKVILYVKDNYVDPKRVKPKEMMIAALEYVEKAVPDVMVDGNPE